MPVIDPALAGMDSMTSVTAQARSRLLSLDSVRSFLAGSEPLSLTPFTFGPHMKFYFTPGWQHGIESHTGQQIVAARLTTSEREFQLTKDFVLEAAALAGIRRETIQRSPHHLAAYDLNHWFREGLAERFGTREYQILAIDDTAYALTRGSVQPYSNLRLLDEIVAGIRPHYDGDILVDYKTHHSLRRTHLRLVLPDLGREILPGDDWSVGVQFKNSLIGEERTAIERYLFRWVCTNGQIDTTANDGAVWSRRHGDAEAAYAWARHTVDAVLGGLEPALDAVAATTRINVEDEITELLRDVFTHYRIPLAERAQITELIANAPAPITMYTVMNAVTQVANTPGLEPGHVENLLRIGGDLPHAAAARCGACSRLMPH